MTYPAIDGVIVALGPLSLRWYGVMYLLGFAAFYLLGTWRSRRRLSPWTPAEYADILFYGVVGVVVGGRVGFALFYGFEQLLRDPLWLLRIWEGGMSFHGGLLGVVAAVWLHTRKRSGGTRLPGPRDLLAATDQVAPLAPIGLGLGRLGNFINAELPGRVTESPLGVHFPCASVRDLNLACFGEYEAAARHVSSLYQAGAEGVALFALVWLYAARPRAVGRVSGMFLLGYGCLRLATELFRQPDADRGFVAFEWLTTGQLLSLPMVALGLYLLFNARTATGGEQR